jgi:transcriptional regulator GlxA family with amidase domain
MAPSHVRGERPVQGLDGVLTRPAAFLTGRCRVHDRAVSRASEDSNRRMLRARDAMDRSYAEPLDVPTLARLAHVSEAHFIRTFRATFGETPNRYLQRRRVERAMFLLRSTEQSVTDVCMAVGFASLGTFSRVFAEIVGEPPSVYRRRGPLAPVPSCFGMRWLRPGSNTAVSEKPGAQPRP